MLSSHLYSLMLAVFIVIGGMPQKSAAGQFGINGPDNRTIVEDLSFPWRAIGRVNNAGRGFCTGVLIGERQVLTAGHCISSRGRGTNLSPVGDLHFLAGYQRGAYLAHSQVIGIMQDQSRRVRQNVPDDWAVLTLAKPLGRKLGYLTLEAFDPAGWRIDRQAGILYAQAGYSQDRPHVLTRHADCTIDRFDPSGVAFAHQCDATHGDSGSPILVRRKAGYRIVGIHVASARAGGFGVAIAGVRILARMTAPAPIPPPRGER